MGHSECLLQKDVKIASIDEAVRWQPALIIPDARLYAAQGCDSQNMRQMILTSESGFSEQARRLKQKDDKEKQLGMCQHTHLLQGFKDLIK